MFVRRRQLKRAFFINTAPWLEPTGAVVVTPRVLTEVVLCGSGGFWGSLVAERRRRCVFGGLGVYGPIVPCSVGEALVPWGTPGHASGLAAGVEEGWRQRVFKGKHEGSNLLYPCPQVLGSFTPKLLRQGFSCWGAPVSPYSHTHARLDGPAFSARTCTADGHLVVVPRKRLDV